MSVVELSDVIFDLIRPDQRHFFKMLHEFVLYFTTRWRYEATCSVGLRYPVYGNASAI